MATKQKTAVKSAVTRERKRGIVREEKHVLTFLIVIILLLLYLLLAQYKGWWPYSPPKLGTAFYTNLRAQTPTKSEKGSDDSKKGGSGTNSGGSNSGGTTNTTHNTTNTTNPAPSPTPTPTPTPTPSGNNPILNLAGGIDVGNTKASVSSQANGLNEHCAVVVNAVAETVGKQEVCTYSQGDKVVTVTYLNDRVISASKSGF